MCKVTSQMVVADGAAVGQSLENIAAALQATDPTLATNLANAGKAVVDATANWQEGSPLTDVEDAENAAIAVLNLIPVTSPFAPLVAIAFTALNLLIANGQTQATQTGSVVANAHVLLSTAKAVQSPWQGKADMKHNPFKSIRKNFEDTFNEKAGPLGVKPVTV